MNEKILVVDDEQDILNTLDTVLTKEGYQVRSALEGNEAVGSFKSEPFDLVITDIKMPGMDGLEVMRRVKGLDGDMEVIVLTGFATMENAIQALRTDGAFDYLSKPLEDIDDLINTVSHALEKRRLRLENQKLLEDLERRVKERTAELSTANQFLRHEIGERKRVEEELRIAHHGLEKRVKERTAENSKTNKQLQKEINDRRQAEKALRKSEGQLRTLIQNIQAAVLVHSSNK